MILVKANRLDTDPRHGPDEGSQRRLYVYAYSRIQDPSAVFRNPHDVVLKTIGTMTGQQRLHTSIIPPTGSFLHG